MKLSSLATLGLAGILVGSGVAAQAQEVPVKDHPKQQDAAESDRIKKLEEQVNLLLRQQSDNAKRIQDLMKELQSVKKTDAAPAEPISPITKADQGTVLATIKPAVQGRQRPTVAGSTQPGLQYSGDVTFRFDNTSIGSLQTGLIPEGDQGSFRQRIRLNLGIPLANNSDALIGLTTATDANPTSPFTALGNAFREKPFNIGRAYVNYYLGDKNSPTTPYFLFGKMDNPLWVAKTGGWDSEIAWDHDITPEGIAFKYPVRMKTGSKLSLTNTSAFYSINVPSKQRFIGLTTDIYSIVNQLKAGYGPIQASFGYMNFDNLNSGLFSPIFQPGFGIDPTTATSAFLLRGNAGLQATNGHYGYGPSAFGFGSNTFSIFHFTGQFMPSVKSKYKPFLVGEYLHNASVPVLNDGYGITLGFTKGTNKKRGDMTGWITYRDVDADATLGTFADSDLGAGTDYKGFQIGLSYRLQDNMFTRIAYHDFDGAPAKTGTTRRFFLDFVRTF